MDRDELQEKYGEETDLLFLGTDAKEFDSAIIGISEDMNAPHPRVVYSVQKCLDIIEADIASGELEEDDDPATMALEHFTYNISGGYVGEKTPVWCWDL